MQSCRSFKLNAPVKDDTGLKKSSVCFFFHPLCFVTQRRKVFYMVDCRINYSRISTFDLFALKWGSWLWCQECLKIKSLCRHLSLIVLPIKTYNSMIYLNFSAKTLKTILTRLQIVCICFTGVHEKKTYTIWKIILNKIRDLAPRLTLSNKLQTLNFRGPWFLFWSGDGQIILISLLTQSTVPKKMATGTFTHSS